MFTSFIVKSAPTDLNVAFGEANGKAFELRNASTKVNLAYKATVQPVLAEIAKYRRLTNTARKELNKVNGLDRTDDGFLKSVSSFDTMRAMFGGTLQGFQGLGNGADAEKLFAKVCKIAKVTLGYDEEMAVKFQTWISDLVLLFVSDNPSAISLGEIETDLLTPDTTSLMDRLPSDVKEAIQSYDSDDTETLNEIIEESVSVNA